MAGSALCISAHANAQAGYDAAPAPGNTVAETANDPEPVQGDIVVTAQKREQNIQDVPLSVQVVGEAQLQANAVTDFADLNRVAPSLVVRPSETPANANISIRGIGTLAFSPGVEPSVAVILDDVPLAFQARAFTDLNDIERIEVLRGPQTTLYGKSASAGLINIVTKAPSRTLTGTIRGMATTDNEQQIGGALSGPLGDTFGFRTSINYDDYAGNVRNRATGDLINGRRYFSTRNRLRWEPTSDFTVDLGLDYADGRTTAGRPFTTLSPAAILRGNRTYTPAVFAPGIVANADNTDASLDLVTGNTYNDFAQSLRISYDLGGPTLMSITAHDTYNSHDALDNDDAAISGYSNQQTGRFHNKQISQELRLVSPGKDRFRYTLGLFYNTTDFDRDFFRGPIFSLANWTSNTGNQQISGFGQLEFDILSGTTLIGGGRYSHERTNYTFNDLRANARYSGNSSDDSGTYKLGLQQKVAPDVTAFLTYATGHKGEAYDISSGFNQARADAGPVRPETSKDWELGVRSQFLDHRVTLNVTLFNTRFNNFQAQGIETLADGTQNFRLTNVGSVRTRGVEVESYLRFAKNFSVGASGTYLDAVITSFPGAACYPLQTVAQGCVGNPAHQDLSGTRPQQAPEWKLTANYDYWHSLGSRLDLVSQGAVTYQSEVNYQLARDPSTVQPGYTIANISLGVRGHDRKWQLVGFVNNLFDKHYRYLLNNASAAYGATAIQGYVPRDFRRYGGVRLSASF
jgi:iron complex outermembrane receptor protein